MNSNQLQLWHEEEEENAEVRESAGYTPLEAEDAFNPQTYVFEPTNLNHFINQLKNLHYEKKSCNKEYF